MTIITLLPAKPNRKQKKLVAAYCRVSTANEQQYSSFQEQQVYYKNKINANPDWQFASIYAEQKSGIHTESRTAFQQMITDALAGKIHIILCKSVSRWARNTVDGLRSLRLLADNHVSVIFEEENLNTGIPGVLFLLNLAAAIAQNESEANSENHKWTYRKDAERGIRNVGSNHYFGYDGKDNTLIPNKDANAVVQIYEACIASTPCREIAVLLNRQGYKTVKGNPFTGRAIKNIIQNEVYKGDLRLQKRPSRNLITKKPDAIQMTKTLTQHHEAIVTEEIWEQAQLRIKKREY